MDMTPEEIFLHFKIVMMSFYCITFIVGTIGNGLVIWISGFRMKTVSAVWFLNLAIADFIFCLFLPNRIIQWLFDSDSEYYKSFWYFMLCNFSMLAINSVVSVSFLTVISFHRCVSIMCPLWAKIHCTRRLAKVTSAFFWIIPLISAVLLNLLTPVSYTSAMTNAFFLLPPPRFYFLLNISNYSEYEPNYYFVFISGINSLLTFGIPFTIILICNCLIIYKLLSNPFRRPKAFHRAFRLIIAVVVCFSVCWFPFNIWPLIESTMPNLSPFVNICVSNACLCLVSISSCMNPILYVLLGHSRGSNSRRSIRVRMENAINDFK